MAKSSENSSSPGAEPKLTVVVCTHNRYDVLADALGSLQEQSMPAKDMEILVVDNSTDIPRQRKFWAETEMPGNLQLVIEPVPGLSRARNIGMAKARGMVVAFIDDDALASSAWCESIVDTFLMHEDAGIAGGPVEPIWGIPRPAWLHPYQEGFFTIVDRGALQRKLEPHEWLAGTNIAFRRTLLEASGGFNEGLGRIKSTLLSNEELAVSRKIHDAGYSSYYEPRARVLHRVHNDRVSQQWMRRRVSWQAVSDLLSEAPKAEPEKLWNKLADYFYSVPPELRGVAGLLANTDSPELFQKQCEAIQAAIQILLDNGRDPMETVK